MKSLRLYPGQGAFFLAWLVATWLGVTAWSRPLMLPDEGRYVGVAWEMLRSGDWLTPTLNGLPYFHKPPLFYWITAASLSTFGMNEWAARAAPLLGATLAAMSLFLFVRRWINERAARLALLLLLVQPFFFIGAQFANLDMLVAGCITATITLLAHSALRREHQTPHRSALAAAYAMAALGVLAKGLIGFVIPALVIGAWLLLRWRWRTLLGLLWLPGALLFVLIAGPWFVLMHQRFPDFLHYFFVVQHFERFAAGGFNNAMPFWFYPVALAIFSLPWLPWRVWSFGAQRLAAGQADRPVRLLMGVWLATVLLFFSLPQSKLLGYVLPAVPPLAFWLADGYLTQPAPSTALERLWAASTALATLLGLAIVGWLAVHPMHSSRPVASALATQRQAGEPVFVLGNYPFDLPFYARLREPVTVVDQWDQPGIAQRDNWRKELADAGLFDPARQATVLITPAQLTPQLCTGKTGWILGPSDSAASHPVLKAATVVHVDQGTTLWRFDNPPAGMLRAPGCEGTPSDGSAGK
jgi:4-amino-4-deoxy-L-arabinose transferase-like glycosyltransferase